ncbi:DDE-type integrase/transposase/recombinase [Paeniglutamicibacter cryotolerans]|uniref:Transposase InsO family protein n=1 Tax=Paeniglutamicibacter cryotolerans TaxID=670079 RepID=A0A839QSA0_9MICC|nr:DDE-type integrase/transposase/recombinase [Paeniglutamicibacter cryotolerans]MBB2997654.1 transposase InsO family protein [Paeniglutamicibacter cryotolerans]
MEFTGSQRRALALAGVSRSTWHYRHKPRERVQDPLHQSERAYESRISEEDRERISEFIRLGWANHNSVDHSFATAWDAGIMLASRRTWWRIAAEIEDQLLRPRVPTKRQNRRGTRTKPVLKATGPGQIWSWDITDVYSPWKSVVFKVYSVMDIFSRRIVAWRVEDREADHLAVEMFEGAITEHGAPHTVHADSGPAMKSHLLRDALTAHGVELSHNRPYVSNDNPFSESGFRTMKYRPGYPRIFKTVESAGAYIGDYVPWYNTKHKHSGIALFSPAQVHDGSWKEVWDTREHALQCYYEKNPGRFRTRPRTPAPANCVGINLPETKPALLSA